MRTKLKIVPLSFLGEEASVDNEGERSFYLCNKCYRELHKEVEAVVAAIPENYDRQEATKKVPLYSEETDRPPPLHVCKSCRSIE